MNPEPIPDSSPEGDPPRIRVWDLPTRVFHWALVLTLVGSVVTIKVAGNWVPYHFWCGYTALTLILFRLAWGFVGGRHARFASFVYGPAATIAYAKGLFGRGGPHYLGHNPMGALSVFALLASVLFQAVTGLFANDDIANEGPLVRLISKELSDQITSLHHLNKWVLLALVAAHVTAILFYLHAKKENLIRPMLDGHKAGPPDQATADTAATRLAAAGIALAAAVLVYYVINFRR